MRLTSHASQPLIRPTSQSSFKLQAFHGTSQRNLPFVELAMVGRDIPSSLLTMCHPIDNNASKDSSKLKSCLTTNVAVSGTNTFVNVVHRWLDRLHTFREEHPSSVGNWNSRRRRRRSNFSITSASSDNATIKSWITAIAFGQLVALLASSVNAASFTLEYHFGIDLPMFQLFIMYVLLSLHLLFLAPNAKELYLPHPPHPREDSMNGFQTKPSLQVPTCGKHDASNDSCQPSSALRSDSGTCSSAGTPRRATFRWKERIPCRRLLVPWYWYCGIAWLDVLSNYLTLLSFRYTSLTSTTLLGSLTVPSTMFVSRILLRKSFQRYHYIGVLLCLLGGTLTLWCDTSSSSAVSSSSSSSSATTTITLVSTATTMATLSATKNSSVPLYISHDVLGDALAMSAAILYGLTDTIAEYSIKHIDRVEYLGMLGLFGTMWTALAFPWIEHVQLGAFWGSGGSDRWESVSTIVWYIASLLGYYVSSSFFLETSDATLLNLSLQAANLWSIVVSVGMYRNVPPFGFYVAIVLVVSGVVVYECGKSLIVIEPTMVKTVRFAEPLYDDALKPNSERQQHEQETGDSEPLLLSDKAPCYDAIL